MLNDPTSSRPVPVSDRLRAAGTTAWSLVGIALLVVAAALLLVILRPLLIAVVVAVFLAIAFAPLVDLLARHRVHRATPVTAIVVHSARLLREPDPVAARAVTDSAT
jgi:predicted PurR-regulated permease PerM